MADTQLQLRITADGSGLTGTLRTASGELREFSTQAKAAGDNAEAGLGKAQRAAETAGKAIAGIVAGAAGAFALIVKQQIDLADAVGSTAQRLGITTEALSALGASAKRNNSDLPGVVSGLDAIGESAIRAATQATTGGRAYAAAFKALGVSVKDAQGQIKGTPQLLQEVAQGLERLPDGAVKSRLAAQLLGQSGKDLSATLDDLAKNGLQGLIDKAAETGEIIDTKAVANAKAFKDGLTELKARVGAFAQGVAQEALPTLLALSELMLGTGEKAEKTGTQASALRGFIEGLGKGVVVTTETFRVLFTMLFAGIDVLVGVGEGAVRAVQGMGLASAAAAAFSSGNLQQASDYAERAKAAFGKGWDDIASHARNAWSNIESAGADADAKIAQYDKRIAASHSQFANVVAGVGPVLDDEKAKTAAAAAALETFAAGLVKGKDQAKAHAEEVMRLAAAEKTLDDQLDSLRGTTDLSAKAQADYEKGLRQLQANAEAAAIAGGDVDVIVRKWQEGEALLQDKLTTTNSELAKRGDVLGNYTTKLAATTAVAIDQTGRAKALADAEAKVTAEFNRNTLAGVKNKQTLESLVAGARAAAGAAFDLATADALVSEFAEKSPILKITDQIGSLRKALEQVSDPMNKAFDPKRAEEYRKALAAANNQLGVQMVGSYAALLGAARAFTSEGSKSYQQISAGMAALQIVQDALAMRAAIIAVLTQGEGEPYSAWARMAAMAAAVAPFLASIGQTLANFGGGGGSPSSNSAEVRQKNQGTGTVLGDAEAKSESIARATEITANATEQLVGLNRGMLNALQALQSALGAAGNQLARGAGEAEFPGLHSASYGLMGPAGQYNPLMNAMTGGNDPIGNAIGGFLWGGKQKVIDQGIIIAGGTLQEMIDSIVVGAYQTVRTSGGLFGHSSTSDQLSGVSDAFSRQFQLVIASIADTVRAGALALGLLPDDVEAALAQFRVEEIRISLKGLSAEDQQKELEAVFSKIFDDLAGAVVPFINQFQQIGEGLGETLVRIATEVQVTQEAFKQLGIAVDETDPERFAQISDALVQATGGLDGFIQGMQTFLQNFAPEAHQFSVTADALTSALGQVGLSLPATRDGMWELMQSLDATTAEGREQIATLLRLADVSSQYYDMLEEQVAEASDYLQSLGLAGAALSKFRGELQSIRESEDKAIESANLLAVAQGREGASAVQVAQIHDWASKQIAAAMRRMQAETRDIIAKLYGGVPGSLDAINERISELEQTTSTGGSAIGDLTNASNELFDSWRDGVKSLNDYLNDSLFGPNSPLNPEQQLAAAQQQLDAAIAAASNGDATALQNLPHLMDQFASLLRGSTASGGDFNGVIDNYRAQLQALLGLANPGTPASEGGQTPIAVAVSASPELQALYAARDAALAEQENAHRAELAQQLATNLHDLAVLTRTPILDMIQLQGVALDKLAVDMGVDLNNLTGASVLALGNMATTLGLSLSDLTTNLGINLTDLGTGVTELTTRLGIDLSNLTVGSTQSLAQLAESLGADVTDLARSVGVDLGNLANAQSLLNQALGHTIDELPQEQRDQLRPLFDAIASATTEADANAAIGNLEAAVNAIGGDAATALAPYLAGVVPPEALGQLDYLEDLQRIAGQTLDVMKDIARGLDVPGYAVGSANIQGDQFARVHDGEMIIDPASAQALRKYGIRVANTGGTLTSAANDDTRAMVVELRALREEVAQLRRENDTGLRANASAIRDEGARARTQRDDLARKSPISRSG